MKNIFSRSGIPTQWHAMCPKKRSKKRSTVPTILWHMDWITKSLWTVVWREFFYVRANLQLWATPRTNPESFLSADSSIQAKSESTVRLNDTRTNNNLHHCHVSNIMDPWGPPDLQTPDPRPPDPTLRSAHVVIAKDIPQDSVLGPIWSAFFSPYSFSGPDLSGECWCVCLWVRE